MRIGRVHLQFWEAKQRRPSWTKDLPGRVFSAQDLINDCVNTHAQLNGWNDGVMAASNLLAIVRSVRRRQADMLSYLQERSRDPGTIVNPEKRAAFARKWALRIRQQREAQRHAQEEATTAQTYVI